MLKSYLVSGYRNMLRNGTPSFVNIAGLSIAIACAVTVFILEDSFYHLDSMHTKGEDIGVVVNHVKNGDEVIRWARSPYPLTEMLRNNASVEHVAGAGVLPANVRVNDKVFSENIMLVDPDFMRMFDFKVIAGNRTALDKKDQVLLTKEMALKYFGNEQVVGEALSIKFNDKDKFDFTVGGVLEDTPANSSIYFDFMVSGAIWRDMNPMAHEDWSNFRGNVFVEKKQKADWQSLDKTFAQYQILQNQGNTSRPVKRVEVIGLPKIAVESYNISGSLSWSNDPSAMISIAIIALFLILLAAFNYMNVAVASISTRLKEIGIRKVVGSSKRQIIIQFMVENMMLCGVALVLGSLIVYFLLLPAFNETFPVKVAFEISSWQMAFVFFGGLLLFMAVVSGTYPSLYVAAFNATKILKGKEKFGAKSLFSRILLSIQFTLSFIIMVGSLIFVAASTYLERMDWGYNKEETVLVRLQSSRQYEELQSLMVNDKNTKVITGSARHIGVWSQPVTAHDIDKEYLAVMFPVGRGYLEAMNLRLKIGRDFDESIESDRTESIIVNECLVRQMGWTHPIGHELMVDSVKRFVIGVVEDFYFKSFFSEIEPAMFCMTPQENFNFMLVKADAGRVSEVKKALELAWKKISPDDPAAVSLQSAVFDGFLQGNRSNNKVMIFIALVTVTLTTIGLFGLVSYNITRRLKEFSVRKVFGASITTLFRLMSRDYVFIVGIAFLIGAPTGALLMNLLIKTIYPMAIPVVAWAYILAIGTMVLIVGLTVVSQFYRVVNENPTETLRIE